MTCIINYNIYIANVNNGMCVQGIKFFFYTKLCLKKSFTILYKTSSRVRRDGNVYLFGKTTDT